MSNRNVKTPCEVVKDLLPLYEDGICSDESRKIVEEHLNECKECYAYYKKMQGEIEVVEECEMEQSKVRMMEGVSAQIKRQKIKLGITIAILVVVAMMFVHTSLFKAQMMKIPAFDRRIEVEDINVKELYELDNGDIYCKLQSKSPMSTVSSSGIIEVPDQYWEMDYKKGWQSISATLGFLEKYQKDAILFDEIEIVFLRKMENETSVKDQKVLHQTSKIYYEGKGDEKKTIWEEGVELEEAPKEVEKRVEEMKEENRGSELSIIMEDNTKM